MTGRPTGELVMLTDLEILRVALSAALLILSSVLTAPRTLAEVADLVVSGSALSRRLFRRFIFAAVCYAVSGLWFVAFFWQHDGRAHRLIIAMAVLCGMTLLPESFLRRVVGFLPNIGFPGLRRHKWARKLPDVLIAGLVVVTALLIFWFAFPDPPAPRW
jgi:hypothetical protein